jgi:hypothetical protein
MSNYIKYHEIDKNPETNEHLAELIESIKANGWKGLPLLADGDQLLNGCHRAAACEVLGIEPEVHQIEISCNPREDDYTDYLLDNFANAFDTISLLQSLKDLLAEGLVDQASVDIIQAEYDKE